MNIFWTRKELAVHLLICAIYLGALVTNVTMFELITYLTMCLTIILTRFILDKRAAEKQQLELNNLKFECEALRARLNAIENR